MEPLWRAELFGGLRFIRAGRALTRFRTQQTGSLLAYLAFHLDRAIPREVLIEMLWPGCEPARGRHSLSVALSSLRHQLEPPDVPPASVIVADRFTLRLRGDAVTSDVLDFAHAQVAAANATGADEAVAALCRAADLYRGDLLAGHYEDWVLTEQQRLADQFQQTARGASAALAQRGDLRRAIHYANRAVAADLQNEPAHVALMRLYVADGQHAAAVRQFRRLAQVLRDDLGTTPGAEAEDLARRALAHLRAGTSALSPLPRKTVARRSAAGGRSSVAAGLAAPPTTPVPQLPARWTRFFGRTTELARLERVLCPPERRGDAVRLVTLTGAGGSGKTRLAIEAAERAAPAFDGAVWFAPLADVHDVERMYAAVLASLGADRPTPDDPVTAIAAALSDRPALLVLDNLEQLLSLDPSPAPDGGPVGADAPSAIRAILARCPKLVCLVTSRQRLGLSGEREIPVMPLPVPGGAEALDRLAACESVQLFVDRAQDVRPDFQLTTRTAPSVAALCDCLEGIPLAIEMAAARAQVLTAAQMVRQLERRFNFLVSRRRDAEARQRTLRASVEWSYQLLPETAQRFFEALAVFRSGWTEEAAEFVCEEPLALDLLALLGECSLVTTEESAGAMRFRCLETLRAFADEKLGDGRRSSLQRRHAHYYARLASEASDELTGRDQAVWLERLDAEHPNLRAAIAWSLGEGAPADLALRITGSLWRYWRIRGHWSEGVRLLEAALATSPSGEHHAERALAHNGAGNLLRGLGDHGAARRHLESAISEYRMSGDERGVAGALNNLAIALREAGDYASAAALLEEALSINCRLTNRSWEASNLTNLALVASDTGEWAEAERIINEAVYIRRSLDDRLGLANALNNYALLLVRRRLWDEAEQLGREALTIQEAVGDPQGASYSLTTLGRAAAGRGDLALARDLHRRALSAKAKLGDPFGVLVSLWAVGELAVREGRWAHAARMLGAAERLSESIGVPAPRVETGAYAAQLAEIKSALAADRFRTAWTAGRSLSWAAAAAEATDALR